MPSGYSGLKAFAFTAGVTIIIFIILYFAKRHNPGLFGQDSFSRSWYSANPNDPLQAGARQPVGEEPRMWEVLVPSWYPFCPRRGLRSASLGRGKGEDEKRGTGCAVVDQNKPGYGEFLVSNRPPLIILWRVLISASFSRQPLSVDKVSGERPTVSPSLLKNSRPTRRTPPTQIRISTIILMPTPPPRPVFPPSTSSRTPFSSNTGGDGTRPPREYLLGTSYVPYTPDD